MFSSLLSGDNERYRSLRNRINQMSKHLRSCYYSQKVHDLKDTSSKDWWNNINALMGRKPKNNAMQSLANELTNGELKPLADWINRTFQGISKDLPKLIPSHQDPELPVPAKYIIPVSEVEKRLMCIPAKKATGPDNVSNWIYRDFAGHLAGPICAIFNSSLRDGFIPTIWKCADIAPLPKVTHWSEWTKT